MDGQMLDEQSPMIPTEAPQGAIGQNEVKKAAEILEKYKKGKTNLEARVKSNEEWYRLRHWEQIRGEKDKSMPEPASAWLFNSIANKHADAMDNYPEPNIRPREEADKKDAETLTSILPVILQRNNYEQTYDDAMWDKFKEGTCIYGAFWNSKLENGLGDIDIKDINILNIFWQPGITDIQQSRNIFTVDLVDNDILEQQYPQLKGILGTSSIDISTYQYDDTVETDDKSAVVDWYYKQNIIIDEATGISKEILHYCKFVNDVVLYASENTPQYQRRGYYDHAQYPFVFDTLFPEKGTPCGFGYVDIAKDPQKYIDKLDQIIMVNSYQVGNPRYFANESLGMNEAEFLDITKPIIHVKAAIDASNLKQHEVKPLSQFVMQHQQNKIEELKETSGNRDFSQGNTSGGVTAASAIAALQEAGSKLSRDPIKASYRKFASLNYICLELIRQFYTEPREFRITGKSGEESFVKFDNTTISPQSQGNAFGTDQGFRKPIFDITITAQKASPFSTVAHNELAKELYKGGFFNPQMAEQAKIALEMMKFDGKDTIIQKVSQNSEMIQTLLGLATIVDKMTGSTIAMQLAQQYGVQPPMAPQTSGTVTETNSLGKAVQSSQNNTSTKAQERAANVAAPA